MPGRVSPRRQQSSSPAAQSARPAGSSGQRESYTASPDRHVSQAKAHRGVSEPTRSRPVSFAPSVASSAASPLPPPPPAMHTNVSPNMPAPSSTRLAVPPEPTEEDLADAHYGLGADAEYDTEDELRTSLWRSESSETIVSKFYAAVAPDSTVQPYDTSDAGSAHNTARRGKKIKVRPAWR